MWYKLQERQDFALRLRWGLTFLVILQKRLGEYPKVPTPIIMKIHSYERRNIRRGLKLPLCSSNAMQVGIHYEGWSSVDPVNGKAAKLNQSSVPECSSCARQLTKDVLYSVIVLSLSEGPSIGNQVQSYKISGSTIKIVENHRWTKRPKMAASHFELAVETLLVTQADKLRSVCRTLLVVLPMRCLSVGKFISEAESNGNLLRAFTSVGTLWYKALSYTEGETCLSSLARKNEVSYQHWRGSFVL